MDLRSKFPTGLSAAIELVAHTITERDVLDFGLSCFVLVSDFDIRISFLERHMGQDVESKPSSQCFPYARLGLPLDQ